MTQDLVLKEKQELQGREQTKPGRVYIPAVDIWEDDDGLTLRADMPGVASEQVVVELNDDVLMLEGEVDLSDYEGMSPIYTEYNIGHFQRSFHIPDGNRYDRDKMQARLTDGVLEVTVPRAEATKPRRISVTTS
jgi:HSP20 family molecular chaperone IbpA